MHIHEYQAKSILREYGITTLEGAVVESAEAAAEAAEKIGGDAWVVKAQIYADTRAKSGGVRFAEDFEEVKEHSSDILCKSLITTDSGVISKSVKKVLIEPMITFDQEYFVAITLDRNIGKIVVIVSPYGGVDVEKNKDSFPDSFIKVELDPVIGMTTSLANKLVYSLGLPKDLISKCRDFLVKLYQIYMDKDCIELEINPFVVYEDELVALDAKVTFDDNALFRHDDIRSLIGDFKERESIEELEHGYIELEGNVGLFVNGAGLSMQTIDTLKKYGGSPANFIDLNGGVSEDHIEEIFYTLLQKEKVKVILINIFGGMLKCDVVANGIVKALQRSERKVPIVARIDGTNSALGKKSLKDSEFDFQFFVNIEEASKQVCEIVEVDA